MLNSARLLSAFRAATIHLLCSFAVAVLVGTLVFSLWYPFPYRELSGGRELFLLVMAVDVVCGPLLTLVLFSPFKPKAELVRDLSLTVLIQLLALVYGLNTVWQARPLYLVQEIDRFKVIAAPDLVGNEAQAELSALSTQLQSHMFAGPQVVAIRAPKDNIEREKVMIESIEGGRDYAQRPDFYIKYEGEAALKSLKRAKPLAIFLQKRPEQEATAKALAVEKGVEISQWMYLPIVARQDWVAVLDKQGRIQGFIKGDGF